MLDKTLKVFLKVLQCFNTHNDASPQKLGLKQKIKMYQRFKVDDEFLLQLTALFFFLAISGLENTLSHLFC